MISSAVSSDDNFVEDLLDFLESNVLGCATTKPISDMGSVKENRRGQFASFLSVGGSHKSFNVELWVGICLGAPRSAIEKVESCELAADHG